MNPTILRALEWQLHLVYQIIILALLKFGKTRYRISIDRGEFCVEGGGGGGGVLRGGGILILREK